MGTGGNHFTATVIFLGLASSRFGSVTVRIPFSLAAETLSVCTSSVMLIERLSAKAGPAWPSAAGDLRVAVRFR